MFKDFQFRLLYFWQKKLLNRKTHFPKDREDSKTERKLRQGTEDRKTERQKDSKTEKKTDRMTDRQKDRKKSKTGKHICRILATN